jgi:hypothetical protein
MEPRRPKEDRISSALGRGYLHHWYAKLPLILQS